MARHSCFSLSLNDWRHYYHMFLKHDPLEDHFHGILIDVLLGRTPTLVKWVYLTQLWVNFSENLISQCAFYPHVFMVERHIMQYSVEFLSFFFFNQSCWNFCSTEFTLEMMIKVSYFRKSLQIYFFRKALL